MITVLSTITNAIEPASGKFKHKGYKRGHGIPSKGGQTTNASISEAMFRKELEYLKGGGSLD